MRLLLTGGVGTGKTTLARQLSLAGAPANAGRPIPVFATDDALWLPEVAAAADPWAAANGVVAGWLARPAPWIIEGVRVPMALAAALRAEGRPPSGDHQQLFDPPLLYLDRAIHYESRAQHPMSAAVASAVLHCERRLGVPVRRLQFSPTLAEELLHDQA